MDLSESMAKENEKGREESGVEEVTYWSRLEPENREQSQGEENLKKIGEFRTALPQVLAVSAINLILLNLGMVLAFPTIAIPELLKSAGDMKFTEEEASWFGSIAFICQPLGSFFSGLLFDPVGRKKTMQYVNVPLLLGWLLIYFSTSITWLYVGGVIMGVGIGFMDAPHITYLGEITQPKWRGILTSYAELCVALGFCVVYLLGTATDWRTISVVSSCVPIIAILSITPVPESPIWLLSKGRKEEAEQSLCWLRGWVRPEFVQEEFFNLVRHSTEAQRESPDRTNSFRKQKTNFGRKIMNFIRMEDLSQKSVLQPFLLVLIYFGFSHAAGVTSTRPFMVEIFREFGTPLDPNWVTAISSVIGIMGYVAGMISLPKTGKRLLSLLSMWGCALTNILMFIYGFFFAYLNIPLIMVSLFVFLNFLWSFGIGQIPWMLISEVFPFKGRGVASGISAALSYVLAFIFTKTYYDTHNNLTLPGVFGLYGIITFIGGCFLYYFLPETEGKTLEQIESIVENHFNKCGGKHEGLKSDKKT